MVSALGAHENQVESVFGGLREGHSLSAGALRWVGAGNVIATEKGRVLNALFVNRKLEQLVVCLILAIVLLVDAVVPLVALSGLFEVSALGALVDKTRNALMTIIDLFLWVKHVVAVLAKSHAFEL